MKELKGQLVGALLVILTAAALVSGAINFQQQRLVHLAEDGVVWVDRTDAGKPAVLALHVQPDSAADLAGIREGDRLIRVHNIPITSSIDVAKVLWQLGPWATGEYEVRRGGVEFKAKVRVRERAIEGTLYYLYAVGVCYLVIGLFVYLRRLRAPHATHFYILCLASFVLFTFHYTGKLNNFDKVMFWGNVLAGLYAPAIFLHFCLAFPESPSRWAVGRRSVLLYLPATILSALWFGIGSGTVRAAVPLLELRWMLDRVSTLLLSATYLAGAAVAWVRSRASDDPLVRQQVKWIRNGALAGVVPYTLLNTLPFALGMTRTWYMDLAVVSLLLIPLTWAYAILRYRLMDVDVIFQQGLVYTVATLGVMGLFYTLVLAKGPLAEMKPGTVAILIMAATLVFQPLRNWVQESMDRYVFYKGRYDYRRTLLEFARDLGSETDMDKMLASAADRLRHTLSLKNVAFFVGDDGGGYQLAKFVGDEVRITPADRLDLSFLDARQSTPLFFEHTRAAFDVVSRDWPASVRLTVSRLDLTYYVPCQIRGRTIAFLGASRTFSGDFLSSEDLELMTTVAGYIGIAVENASLYRSLQRKVREYERLKEFSENIVESINVGIVAADLDDRVESWNSQMEALTGIPRGRATGQILRDLFPPALVSNLDEVRGETGVHQLYKIPLRAKAWAAVHSNGNGHHGNGNGSTASAPAAERLVNVAIAPLVTKESEQIGRLIIFDDVTERAELEQRLVQNDKLTSIGLLAAGVAHEVNTPLAVISTYAQMLTKQISSEDPKSKLLDKIAKQTFRASEIVNSLLNFSRTSKTEFEELDLHRVIRETLSLIEHQLEKNSVRLELMLDPNLPSIRGNPGKLQQVFLNLFLNARDAMEDGGGVIQVATAPDGESVRVTISDTGKGIPAENLPRIFDPFFTTKGAKKGTGLGLAVTYGIVREHNGSIEASSHSGGGTTFELQFPLARKLVNA